MLGLGTFSLYVVAVGPRSWRDLNQAGGNHFQQGKGV